jgi:hypothetical protein
MTSPACLGLPTPRSHRPLARYVLLGASPFAFPSLCGAFDASEPCHSSPRHKSVQCSVAVSDQTRHRPAGMPEQSMREGLRATELASTMGSSGFAGQGVGSVWIGMSPTRIVSRMR